MISHDCIDAVVCVFLFVGASVDYTAQFFITRTSVLAGTVAETNRLVIRLEKVSTLLVR